MSKNKSASAKKAQTTAAVKPADKKADPKEVIIVVKDYELGKGSKRRSWKEGDVFNVPHGWVRNLHQESVMKKDTVAMCFDEVVKEEELENGEMEAVQICTHAMPLATKEKYELLKAQGRL